MFSIPEASVLANCVVFLITVKSSFCGVVFLGHVMLKLITGGISLFSDNQAKVTISK